MSNCSAAFQSCCVADFQIGIASNFRARFAGRGLAGLETCDTAGSEACATFTAATLRNLDDIPHIICLQDAGFQKHASLLWKP
jgi:hypothetical protein